MQQNVEYLLQYNIICKKRYVNITDDDLTRADNDYPGWIIMHLPGQIMRFTLFFE